MNNLLEDSDQVFEWAKLYSTSVASIIAWGFRAKDFNSFWYKDFFEFMDKVSDHCLYTKKKETATNSHLVARGN